MVISIEVKRRVTNRDGNRYSDDMIATTGNAACSIALRNAAFRVIPLALVKPVYEAAKKLAIGDAKSLVQRRAASIDHFAKLGIAKEKVCEALNVRSVDDIQLEHLEILIGYATAIKDGDVSVDEIFKAKEERKASTGPATNPYEEAPAIEAGPPPESPVEVSEKTERDALMGDIRAMLNEVDSTMTKFAPLCRSARLLGAGVQLLDAPIEALRIIHENRLSIHDGSFGRGEGQ